MLAVLGQAALRTLLLAAAVQLGLGLLRAERPQLRLAAWTAVLAASLAMPVLQWAAPLRLSVLPDLPGAALVEAAGPPRPASALEAALPAPAGDATALPMAMPWLEALYLLVVGILLLRLAVGIVLSLQLLRRATPFRPDWAAGTPVRISRDVAAPVTVAHVVLLPPDAVSWPAAMREAVLAHERAHIRRRDFAMLLASQVNRAVFWFSPLPWWLHRRLAALAELASDEEAMEATGDRPGYAEALLEMGRRPGPLLRGLAMARPATLKGRIERVLEDHAPSNPVSPVQQAVLALGAASLSVVAAGPQFNPHPPLELATPAEQRQLPALADLDPSPPASDDLPGPAATPAPPTRAAAQPVARPAARATLPLPPSRAMAQRIRTVRDQGARDAPLKAAAPILANFAPHGGDGPGVTHALDGPASASSRPGQPPAGEPPPPKRTDEPSCTGRYLPKPGSPQADGTPWLKLFLGVRTRARLTGFDVERTSFRTTVLTTWPIGANHVTGTAQGAYGTVDFECAGPDAHL